MRKALLLLFGFALALPLMAQELSEKPEPLVFQTEGQGSSTNQLTVETGLIEDAEAPATLQKETIASPVENKEVASSTNAPANTKTSFFMSTGIQYAEEGEYKEAERAYLRALEADPSNESIQFRLSTLYLLMGRYVEAVPILEELVVEHPENSQIRNNLAWAYATGEGVRNKEKALLHAREAILSAPIVPSMWNTLAEAYYMAGDYERALRASEHAIDLLVQTNPGQTVREDFEAQRMKIQRADQALKRFKGLDDDE